MLRFLYHWILMKLKILAYTQWWDIVLSYYNHSKVITSLQVDYRFCKSINPWQIYLSLLLQVHSCRRENQCVYLLSKWTIKFELAYVQTNIQLNQPRIKNIKKKKFQKVPKSKNWICHTLQLFTWRLHCIGYYK